MVMRSEAPFHSTTKRMEATYSGIMTPKPAPNNNPVPTAARRSICDSVVARFSLILDVRVVPRKGLHKPDTYWKMPPQEAVFRTQKMLLPTRKPELRAAQTSRSFKPVFALDRRVGGFRDAQREEDMNVRNRERSSRHTLPRFSWNDALTAAVLASARPAGANTSQIM